MKSQSSCLVKLKIIFKYLLCSLICILICIILHSAYSRATFPGYLQKYDFLQTYLLTQALSSGVGFYEPIPELEARFVKEIGKNSYYQHRIPHPPANAIIFSPFAWFSYELGALLWLVLRVLAVILGIVFLTYDIKKPQSLYFVLLFLVSSQISSDNYWGQFGALFFFLISGCVITATSRPRLSGFMLASSIAIKFLGVPLLLYFLLKNRSVANATIFSFLLLNIITWKLAPQDTFKNYFKYSAPSLLRLYVQSPSNQSISALAFSFITPIKDFHPRPMERRDAREVTNEDLFFPLLIATAFVGIGVLIACTLCDNRNALAFLAMLSVITIPISWGHTMLVCFIGVAALFKILQNIRSEIWFKLITAFAIFVWTQSCWLLVFKANVSRVLVNWGIPFNILMRAPLLMTLILMTLLVLGDRMYVSNQKPKL